MKFRLAQLTVTFGVVTLGLMGLAGARVDLSDSEMAAIRGRDIFTGTTNAACEFTILGAGEVTLLGCPEAGNGTTCVRCRRNIGKASLDSLGIKPFTTGAVGYRESGGYTPCSLYTRSVGVCLYGFCVDYMPAGTCGAGSDPKAIEQQPVPSDPPGNF